MTRSVQKPEDYLNELVAADNLAEIKLGLDRIQAVWQKLLVAGAGQRAGDTQQHSDAERFGNEVGEQGGESAKERAGDSQQSGEQNEQPDQASTIAPQHLGDPPFVYTIAGTNGKGTCAALLETALLANGLTTGLISSPHLLSFNERIRLNGTPASDSEWLGALERIKQIKGDLPLTYFEYCTLAGLLLFTERQVDVWILEVGLGGRLDAVNIIDSDCAVITSIGLDHTEILGDTREKILAEKMPVARANKPLVMGEKHLPANFDKLVADIGAKCFLSERDFRYDSATPLTPEHSSQTNNIPPDSSKEQSYQTDDTTSPTQTVQDSQAGETTPIPPTQMVQDSQAGEATPIPPTQMVQDSQAGEVTSIPPTQTVQDSKEVQGSAASNPSAQDYLTAKDSQGNKQRLPVPEALPSSITVNLATTWQALLLYKSNKPKSALDPVKISRAWQDFNLQGRWEHQSFGGLNFVFDCAHNPAAAKVMLQNLDSEDAKPKPQLEVIFAVQKNKDWQAFLRVLAPKTTAWHLLSLHKDNPKMLPPNDVADFIRQDPAFARSKTSIHVYENPADLLKALTSANPSPANNKLFLVCGSFHTIGEVFDHIKS